ncbi:hypothetical protein E8E12_007371 [Didymella heteroderae]|uniref:Uncharacterized protein n=1 Tax=Didymella heteroderae TaxID=1769908 RepID=A0A9P5BZC0_9PLEO|nr:hypothetical protein E8E12_007371 [Didymella heteroderae]
MFVEQKAATSKHFLYRSNSDFAIRYCTKSTAIMLSKTFAFALLAATCVAARYPNETNHYSWTVPKFNGTCLAAACWAWGFSISGTMGPAGQPAFKASDCNIDSRIDGHQQCKGVEVDVPGNVAVQIDGPNINGGLLTVQYTYQQ